MKKLILIALFLASCAKAPKTNNEAIANFELEKYLGTWYEIARYDHSFEKDCDNVKAKYSKLKNGKIRVINSCTVNGKKKEAKAVAYFEKTPNIAHLKVSFFRPFYGDYKVIYLDKNYQYAIIDGGSYDYFWILARKPRIEQGVLAKILEKAKDFGYEKQKMIFTKQN